MGLIYIHANKLNGKAYVGQTWETPARRWGHGYKECPRFQNAIKKHGWDGFDHQIVAEADTQEKLDNLEKVWIILLQSGDPEFGYNLASGGGNGRHSAESRAKISAAMLGRKHGLGHKVPLEARAKISAAMLGNKNSLGRKMSPENRAKLVVANSHKLSPEHRASLREAWVRRKQRQCEAA
jgi:group I intron endonuclease